MANGAVKARESFSEAVAKIHFQIQKAGFAGASYLKLSTHDFASWIPWEFVDVSDFLRYFERRDTITYERL